MTMRGNHTMLERLFEDRQVNGVPVSNMLIVCTIAFIVIRNMFFRLSSRIAKKITNNGHAGDTKVENGRRSHEFVARKCQKYMYYFIWFSVMCPWCFSIASRWPEFDFSYGSKISKIGDHLYGRKRLPSGEIIETMDASPLEEEFHLFMMIQLCWYLHNFVEDTLWDRHRADHTMMVSHHIVAMLLIFLSFQAGADLAGLYIIFPLDLMDYLLYTLKLFQVFTTTIDGEPLSAFLRKIQKMLLYAVATLWIATRWIMYGSAVYHFHKAYLSEEFVAIRADGSCPPHVAILLTLLDMLYVMQIVWGVMVVKMAFAAYHSGAVQDKIYNTYGEVKKQK
eukprot:GEMP01014857.1.p1 GENE.GEMP01014857.1~~GEMP01014857.1.p1  ORF type:complete len:336 (+),score=26.67 GEMP01014857.1:112-1119(+)